MRYLGGKARQSKHIVAAIQSLHPDFKVYVEPFCGALWSACAVMKAFPDRKYILNDINPYLITMWRAALDGWDPPEHVTEDDYEHYNRFRPADDPMTGYVGFAWSFGGKFMGGAARTNGHMKGSWASTMRKIRLLRENYVALFCGDYSVVPAPDGAMVYLDPPYADRTKQMTANATLDAGVYREWARDLSSRATVIATEFTNDHGWAVLHDFGDTVVRHLNAKEPDGTRELLMLVGRPPTMGGQLVPLPTPDPQPQQLSLF